MPSWNFEGRPERGGFGRNRHGGDLKIFTLRFLWDVRSGGGHLTLDKNTRSGTLALALTLLRPHLPPGLIPPALPFSSLSWVKALDGKLANADIRNPNL